MRVPGIRLITAEQLPNLHGRNTYIGQLLKSHHPNGTIYQYEAIKPGVLIRIPFGFDSLEKVCAFAQKLDQRLREIGIRDAKSYIVGSAARGVAHSAKAGFAGQPYDKGRVSDVEIEIISDTLAYRCFGESTVKHGELKQRLTNLSTQLEELIVRDQLVTKEQKRTKKENRRAIRLLEGEIKVVRRQIMRLEEMLGKGRLKPNSDNIPELVDLRRNVLPQCTNRPIGPAKAVGIRISREKNARDLEESSYLLMDQKINFVRGEQDQDYRELQIPAGIPV